MEIFDVVDDLLQTGRDGKAAAVGALTEKDVKVADPVGKAGFKVAVAHGQLIKIAEHGQVEFFFLRHKRHSSFSNFVPLL